jgi:hypothetical protein
LLPAPEQYAGFWRLRICEVIQTRPIWSIIGLWGLAGSTQICRSPKLRYGWNLPPAKNDGIVEPGSRVGRRSISDQWFTGSAISRLSFPMSTP